MVKGVYLLGNVGERTVMWCILRATLFLCAPI